MGEEWVDSGNIAEIQGSGDVNKGRGDSGSLILEGLKPCLHERSEVAPTVREEHV